MVFLWPVALLLLNSEQHPTEAAWPDHHLDLGCWVLHVCLCRHELPAPRPGAGARGGDPRGRTPPGGSRRKPLSAPARCSQCVCHGPVSGVLLALSCFSCVFAFFRLLLEHLEPSAENEFAAWIGG